MRLINTVPRRIAKENAVFFLYLYSPGTPEAEQDLVEKASTVLMSKQTFAYRTSDAALLDKYSSYLRLSTNGIKALSGLLVFKDHDASAPVSRFYPSSIGDDLTAPSAVTRVASWLKAEHFPSVVELTGTTFSDVIYNEAKALVVLAIVSDVYHGGNVVGTGSGTQERDLELKLFESIAMQWRNSPRPLVQEKLIWAWIDADRWATAVKTYYKVRAVDVPRLVLVDGARLQYYDLPGDAAAAARGQPWLDSTSIFDTLEAVSQGQVTPKSSETVVDRSMHLAGGAAARLIESVSRHPYLSLVLLGTVAALFIRVLLSSQREYAPLLPTAGKLD